MALTRGWGQNSAMTPLDARFFTAGMLQKNADNSVRYGQLWGSGAAVTSTSSMAVSISECYWAVGRGLSDGAVVLRNSGGETVTLPAAPASNSRYDVIWVKQDDSTQGDADALPVFGVTSGTVAASPVVPNAPTGALAIALVLVPSGVTATNASGVTISNTYKFAALSGSPIRYRSYSDLQADSTNVLGGSLGFVRDSFLYVMRSGVWVRLDGEMLYKTRQPSSQSMATGSTEATLGTATTAANTSSDAAIFPLRTDCVIGPLPVAGYYEVVAQVVWSANSNLNRYIEITQTDAQFSPPVEDYRPAMSSGGTRQNLIAIEHFNAGDYIKLKGWQNSGSTLTYTLSMAARLSRAD